MSNITAADNESDLVAPNDGTSPARNLTMADLYTVGSLILFNSSGMRGYITSINNERATCDVRYKLEQNRIEENVSFNDITLTHIGNNSTRRGTNRNASLPPSVNDEDNTFASEDYKLLQNAITTSLTYYSKRRPTSTNDVPPPHPLIGYLHSGKEKPKGWICNVVRQADPNHNTNAEQTALDQQRKKRTHLDSPKILHFFTIMMFIVNSGMNQYAGPFKGASALLCHGFGINRKSRFDIVDRLINNDFATRKI